MEIKQIVILILFLLICGFIGISWAAYDRKNRQEKLRERVQAMCTSGWVKEVSSDLFLGNNQNKSMLERKISEILSRRLALDKPLNLKLHRCGIKVSSEKFILFLFFCWGLFFLSIDYLILQDVFKSLLISIFAFYFIVYMAMGFMERKRGNLILSQLSPTIDIILRGIRSGGTLEKGFSYVVRETPSPLKEEFIDIMKGLEFGLSYETVLHTASLRIHIPEFYFFSTALIIQRQSGGSLSDVLANIISSLNKIQELQLKIKSLSAESKASGFVLCGVPLLIVTALSYFRPEHVAFFLYEETGKKLTFIMIALLFMGILVIKRLTKIEL